MYSCTVGTVGIAVADEASDAFALGGTEGREVSYTNKQQSLEVVYLTMISAHRNVRLTQAQQKPFPESSNTTLDDP